MAGLQRIASDIGGTFTDIVYIDENTMEVRIDKAHTTPHNPVEGVMEAVRKIGADLSRIEMFINGSTIATNVLVQRKGSVTGLITTQGFRDSLELRRGNRPDDAIYDITWEKPKPLVPRFLRREVSERIRYNGEVLRPLDPAEVEEIVAAFKAAGVEAVAVSLLHSYANPEHEQQVRAVIEKVWPEAHISLSHEVAREIREYPRTSTVVIDAYVKKPTVSYLRDLKAALREGGLGCDLLVASSSGGVSTAELAERAPVQMIASGPAGGAIGAAYLGSLLGIPNLVTADVGGTSYDVSLIFDSEVQLRTESEIQGHAVKFPAVDVRSVGAGGGSIAYVDEGGLLHVGPESAGADPGPMCYGRGGERPTVTDAAVVLGLIDANAFAAGQLPLDRDRALEGVGRIAEALGLDVYETAEGILTVARSHMADLIRQMLVGQGHDPRSFAMLSYGGGGGLFATGVTAAMGIPRVIIPVNPSVFSAWGMLSADVIQAAAVSYISPISSLSADRINTLFAEMEQEVRGLLQHARIPEEDLVFVRSLDARYEGQGHEVEVTLPDGPYDEGIRDEIARRFDEAHEARYGHRIDSEREAVTFRLRGVGRLKGVALKRIPVGGASPDGAEKGRRRVFLEGRFLECPVYDRGLLQCGNVITGPALIEEPTHTTVLMSGQELRVDPFGNLIIEIGG